MECTLLFDPVQYIYLNPELNLATVEEALTHYTSNPESGLLTDLDLPSTFSPRVYAAYAKDAIASPGAWMPEDVRAALAASDPERLAVIHYMRERPADAVVAVDPTFNDALFRIMYQPEIAIAGPASREDLFLMYLERKQSDAVTVIGNVDEVALRLRENARFTDLSVGGSLFAGVIVADELRLSCSPAAYAATSPYFLAKAEESNAHATDCGLRTPGALLAPAANVFTAPTYFLNDVVLGGRTLAMCEDYIASNVSNIAGPLRVANHLHVEDDLFVSGTLTANALRIPYKGSSNLARAGPARDTLAQRDSMAALAEGIATPGAVLGADASVFTKPVYFTNDVFFGDDVLTICADFVESNMTHVLNDVHFGGNVHVTSTLRAGVIAANAIRLDCTTGDTVPEADAVLEYLSTAEPVLAESLVVPGLGALTPAGAMFDGPVVFRGDVVFGRNVSGTGGSGGCCGGGCPEPWYDDEGDVFFRNDVRIGGVVTAGGLRIQSPPSADAAHLSIAAAILEDGGMDCGSMVIGSDAVVFTKPVYFTKDLVLAETPLEFARRLSTGENATHVTGDLNVGGVVRASRLEIDISPLDDRARAMVERAEELRAHAPPDFAGMVERGLVMDEDGSVVFTGRVLFTQPVTFGSNAVVAGDRAHCGSTVVATTHTTSFEEVVDYHVRYQSNLTVRGTLTVSALRINCGNIDYDADAAQERADQLVRDVRALPDPATRCAKLETAVAEVTGAAVFHGPVVFRDSVFFDTTAAFEASDRDQWWGALEGKVLSVANAAVGHGCCHHDEPVPSIQDLSVATAVVAGTLSVGGAAQWASDVRVAGDLSVGGNARFASNVCLEGPVCFAGDATFAGSARFRNGLNVEYGNAIVHHDLIVDKHIKVGESLVASVIGAASASIGGDAHVGGVLRAEKIEIAGGSSIVSLREISFLSISDMVKRASVLPTETTVVFEGGFQLPGATFGDEAIVFDVPCVFRQPIYIFSNVIYGVVQDLEDRIAALEHVVGL